MPANVLLRDVMSSVPSLERALDRLRKSSTGAGVDGITPARFREKRTEHLSNISNELRARTFSFQKLKAVPIKKPDGGHRLIAIPTVADRVVQKALLDAVLPHIAHLVNTPGSHAYLSQRGLATAINDVKRHIRSGNRSIIQTDIIKFFDKIKAREAIDRLVDALPDDSLGDVLEQYVGWEVDGLNKLEPDIRKTFPADGKTTGLPQGTALAPVLANMMLGGIDRAAAARGIAVVRYADDIVILAKSPSLALDAFDWYESQLATLGLSVHNPRAGGKKATEVPDISTKGIEYLGCYIKEVDGQIRVRPQEAKIVGISNTITKIFTTRGRQSFPQRVIAASQAAEAWIASYRSLCGMKRVSKRVSDTVAIAIEKSLQQRGILPLGKTLDHQQRAFLGLAVITKRSGPRPTRAFVKLPNRSKPTGSTPNA
ncbi:reverse transcriptase domain-containing protein [Gemmatimonas sp.]|jgi:group II intron reverse transcriptase/maturase|uniref:reverse transcriptase domain-containing protein n=1 Tax=Gemmatimonas sp. TaxID=1962908 RepID=UPI0037C0C17A